MSQHPASGAPGRARHGAPTEDDSRRNFSLRLPKALHRALRIHSVEEGRSLNDVLVGVIEVWWNGRPPIPGDGQVPPCEVEP